MSIIPRQPRLVVDFRLFSSEIDLCQCQIDKKRFALNRRNLSHFENGRTGLLKMIPRLFGTASQIVQAVAAAGSHVPLDALQHGLMLNLPCLAITELSRDGRYLNVTQILPPVRGGNGHV